MRLSLAAAVFAAAACSLATGATDRQPVPQVYDGQQVYNRLFLAALDALERRGNFSLDAYSQRQRQQQQQQSSLWQLLLRRLPPRLDAAGGGGNCSRHVAVLLNGLLAAKPWALRFGDSWGKPAAGLLDGAGSWLGSYDECQRASGPQFVGGYCTVRLAPRPERRAAQLLLGTCWPASCRSADVEGAAAFALQQAFAFARLQQSLFVVRGSASCKRPVSELGLTPAAVAAISVLGVLGCLLAAGTCLDACRQLRAAARTAEAQTLDEDSSHNPDTSSESTHLLSDFRPSDRRPILPVRLLLCFSVPANASKLFNLSVSETNLGCVNGIRFLSMSWIILGHTYVLGGANAANLGQLLPQWLNDWTFQAILNATVAVDTFFVLSGLLSAYLFFRELDRRQGQLRRINWLMFYLHRYWRLTPTYMLILGTYVSLGRYLYSGPQYPQEAAGFEPKCTEKWWQNLLYVNNLFSSLSDMCMAWTWYLANDVQLYAVSPIFLAALSLKPAAGAASVGVALLGVTVAAGLRSTSVGAAAGTGSDLDGLYTKPWFRAAPYLVGLLGGFLLHRATRSSRSDGRLRLRWWLTALGWSLAAGACGSVLYGLFDVQRGQRSLSQPVASLYNCTFRLAWSLAVLWTILACATGNGGWANSLLSHRLLAPLSRLTFCAYLVHPVVIVVHAASRRDSAHWDTLTVMYNYFGNLVLSFTVAAAASLAFESPFIGLERILRGL